MKISTKIAAALTVAIILACGGGEEKAAPPPPPEPAPVVEAASALTEPWKSLNVPIGSGEIVESDASHLLVAYDVASLTDLTNSWSGALLTAGYTQSEDVSSPGITAIVYQKAGQFLGLATGQEEGVNFAYMEDLGKVANSVVRGKAKTGVSGKRAGRAGRTKAKVKTE